MKFQKQHFIMSVQNPAYLDIGFLATIFNTSPVRNWSTCEEAHMNLFQLFLQLVSLSIIHYLSVLNDASIKKMSHISKNIDSQPVAL